MDDGEWVAWPLQRNPGNKNRATGTGRPRGTLTYWHLRSPWNRMRTACALLIPATAETSSTPADLARCQRCVAYATANAKHP